MHTFQTKYYIFFSVKTGSVVMARELRTHTVLAENLSLVPGTHVGWLYLQWKGSFSSFLCLCTHAHTHTHLREKRANDVRIQAIKSSTTC